MTLQQVGWREVELGCLGGDSLTTPLTKNCSCAKSVLGAERATVPEASLRLVLFYEAINKLQFYRQKSPEKKNIDKDKSVLGSILDERRRKYICNCYWLHAHIARGLGTEMIRPGTTQPSPGCLGRRQPKVLAS